MPVANILPKGAMSSKLWPPHCEDKLNGIEAVSEPDLNEGVLKLFHAVSLPTSSFQTNKIKARFSLYRLSVLEF